MPELSRGQLMPYLLQTFLINCGIAAVPALLYLLFASRAELSESLRIFVWSSLYANAIGFPAAYILPRLMPRLSRYRPQVRWAAVVALLAAIGIAGSTLVSLLLAASEGSVSSKFAAFWVGSLKISLALTLTFGIGSILYRQNRSRLEETTLALRTRELEMERAEKLAAEARLQSLESRIHPHFLFNALNSVSALIREQPELAERQVERICRFLRFALDRGSAGLVPLAEELRIVADYLEIERTRFGPRLRFQIEAPPETLGAEVPALSVQTLVENSVKYAVAPRREGGMIRVVASLAGDGLSIGVHDDGPGFDASIQPAGHGLDLLRGRLAAHFGNRAALQFSNGAGMSVRMEVPCVRS